MTAPWGSDAIISMPAPVQQEVVVDMGGFAFTEHGLAHNLSTSDLEVYLMPTFRPAPMPPER